MKFASVVAALSLLPASAAFAPPAASSSLRTGFQTTSSSSSSLNEANLQKWFENIFDDRNDKMADEIDSIKKSLKQLNLHEKAKKARGPTPEEEKANKEELKDNNKTFKFQPLESQTGVSEHIARLAATFSDQLYHVPDPNEHRDKFELSTVDHDAEVVIKDMKSDKYQPTNPPFAAVVCDNTMILGWRGSNTPTDWINDLAWSPCSNLALGEHAKNIKLQGGMTSLCLNDICMHQETIISECKKHNIRKIVTTGHSLGGGIAQIAHTILRAQMQNEKSPWNALKEVKLQSLGFSGPMTTQIVKDGCSDETKQFIEEINENSCMVVYNNDFVPRSYGYWSYMNACLEDCAQGVGQFFLDDKPIPFFFTKQIIDRFATMLEKIITGDKLALDIVDVFYDYVHPGKIISYKSDTSKPRVLVDYGAFHKNTQKTDTFRSEKYQPVGWGKNAIDDILPNHFGPIYGMEYNDSEVH